ncbi:MAG: teaD [Sporomusa sp.]|nr:teaD [Sporomusa sp.]
MLAFRNILVPVDGSENSQKALAYAAYLAGVCQASVGILHVVNLAAVVSSVGQSNMGVYIPDRVFENLQESGQAMIDEALKQLPPTVQAQGFMKIGAPPDVIVSFCAANGYDLIVMGSRGLGTFKELVLGSVSSYVLHRAPCPVMVTK